MEVYKLAPTDSNQFLADDHFLARQRQKCVSVFLIIIIKIVVSGYSFSLVFGLLRHHLQCLDSIGGIVLTSLFSNNGV